MNTTHKTLLDGLLEAFSNKGLSGAELNQTILAAGAYASLLTGNQKATEHFLNRLNQTQEEAI
jgi:hypothetical protein